MVPPLVVVSSMDSKGLPVLDLSDPSIQRQYSHFTSNSAFALNLKQTRIRKFVVIIVLSIALKCMVAAFSKSSAKLLSILLAADAIAVLTFAIDRVGAYLEQSITLCAVLQLVSWQCFTLSFCQCDHASFVAFLLNFVQNAVIASAFGFVLSLRSRFMTILILATIVNTVFSIVHWSQGFFSAEEAVFLAGSLLFGGLSCVIIHMIETHQRTIFTCLMLMNDGEELGEGSAGEDGKCSAAPDIGISEHVKERLQRQMSSLDTAAVLEDTIADGTLANLLHDAASPDSRVHNEAIASLEIFFNRAKGLKDFTPENSSIFLQAEDIGSYTRGLPAKKRKASLKRLLERTGSGRSLFPSNSASKLFEKRRGEGEASASSKSSPPTPGQELERRLLGADTVVKPSACSGGAAKNGVDSFAPTSGIAAVRSAVAAMKIQNNWLERLNEMQDQTQMPAVSNQRRKVRRRFSAPIISGTDKPRYLNTHLTRASSHKLSPSFANASNANPSARSASTPQSDSAMSTDSDMDSGDDRWQNDESPDLDLQIELDDACNTADVANIDDSMGVEGGLNNGVPSHSQPQPQPSAEQCPTLRMRIAGLKESVEVFLGGSCNPTTWRRDVAIPMLDAAGITYFNPQVDNWSPDLVDLEARQKESADILLFVIASNTRATASMVEVSEYIASGRKVVLVVEELPSEKLQLIGEVITGTQLKDLQRGRNYLMDVALRHGVETCTDVRAGMNRVIAMLQSSQRRKEHRETRKHSLQQKNQDQGASLGLPLNDGTSNGHVFSL